MSDQRKSEDTLFSNLQWHLLDSAMSLRLRFTGVQPYSEYDGFEFSPLVRGDDKTSS